MSIDSSVCDIAKPRERERELPKKTNSLGVFYMFISALGFTLMTFALKLSYHSCNLGPFEGIYIRGSSMVVLNLCFATINGIDITKIPRTVAPSMWLRTLIGTVGITFNFLGPKYLPISIHTSLFYLYPLLTSLGAYFLLNERLNKLEVAGTIVSFVGVLCTIVSARSEGSALRDIELYKYSFSLCAAGAATGVYLVTRKMGMDVHYIINPTWFGVVQSMLVTPVWLYSRSQSQSSLELRPEAALHLLLMCLGGWIGQMFMNQSLQIEKAGRVAAVGYLQIPMLFLCDIFYFKLHITWQTMLGSLLIIACSFTSGLLRLFNVID